MRGRIHRKNVNARKENPGLDCNLPKQSLRKPGKQSLRKPGTRDLKIPIKFEAHLAKDLHRESGKSRLGISQALYCFMAI